MKVRGRRECKDCGATWSYYETGSVTCPDCGSPESVGVGDRALHTAAQVDLDLTAVRSRVDADPLSDVAGDAKSRCREYLRTRGYIDGGDLLPLDDTVLAAHELVEVADVVARARDVDDDAAVHLVTLLRGADEGERPPPDSVPERLHSARGLAVATAVDDYLREVRDWLAEHPHDEVRPVVERLDDHIRRVRALQGDVDPSTAERLVESSRNVSAYLRTDGDEALEAARAALDSLD